MDDNNGATTYTLIRDLPASDRPRERLRDFGAKSLSAAELLAILLRTGSSKESALAQAQRLLKEFKGIGGIADSSFQELCLQRGLGEAKAAQLKAAIELGVRAVKSTGEERTIVRSPDDIARLVVDEMSLLEQEHLRVVLLDTRNHVLAIPEVYRGSVHTIHVRLSELLREAVRANAAAIIPLHNHPSGDATPSAPDITMTKQLVEAGKLIDIDVLDHMIIAGGKYVSMKNLRLGFSA